MWLSVWFQGLEAPCIEPGVQYHEQVGRVGVGSFLVVEKHILDGTPVAVKRLQDALRTSQTERDSFINDGIATAKFSDP